MINLISLLCLQKTCFESYYNITIFTVWSVISMKAIASITIYLISAISAILTRTWGAFINIWKMLRTRAVKCLIYLILILCQYIKTYVLVSVTNSKWYCNITIFTVKSIISINAGASVIIYLVSATSTVLTRACGAFINIYTKVFNNKGDQIRDLL